MKSEIDEIRSELKKLLMRRRLENDPIRMLLLFYKIQNKIAELRHCEGQLNED